MRELIVLIILAFASSNVALFSRIFQIETGEVFLLKTVSTEDAPHIESTLGCSLKCTDMCFQFSKGTAAVQCTEQCGCKDLLVPMKTTQLFSDFSVEITTPKTANDDWDIDLTIGQDKEVNIEAGTDQVDETTTETHVEVDVAGADPNNKEFTYSKVKTESTDENSGSSIKSTESEWTTPGGALDGGSKSYTETDGQGNYDTSYEAELPNQEVAVEYDAGKYVTPTESGATVEKEQYIGIAKNSTDPITGEKNTTVAQAGYESSTEYSGDQTSGTMIKEERIGWEVVTKKSVVPETGCNVNCKYHCNEFGRDDVASCMTACIADFCNQEPAQVTTVTPKPESFGIWAWVVSIAILGIAVVMFLRKIYGTKKSRRVMVDSNESSASYKILV